MIAPAATPLTLAPLPRRLRRQNLERRLPRGRQYHDRTGEIIDGCEILGFAGITRPTFATWLYRCRCGKLGIVTSNALGKGPPGCGVAGTSTS